MNSASLKVAINLLRKLPFTPSTEGFIIHPSHTTLFDDLMEKLNLEITLATNPSISQALGKLKVSVETYKELLPSVVISNESVRLYRDREIISDDQKRYQDLFTPITHAFNELLFTNMGDPSSEFKELQIIVDNNDDSSYILNKNNPFADVTIKDRQFLYPNSSGDYETLVFATGNTLTKVSTFDGAVLALQPGFKITKTSDRSIGKTTVYMDDTISTPIIPDTSELDIVYL